MSENKYLVIKQSDWEKIERGITEATPSLIVKLIDDLRINDAFVLRLQDQLATSALYAYASSVQTAIEILEPVYNYDHQIGANTEIPELGWKIEMMKSIRDAAFEWAERGRAAHKKLPD